MRHVLLVTNAGHGSTPPWLSARFSKGDVVSVSRGEATGHFPPEMIVIGIVPPWFPVEYALADLLMEPRPLMITKEKRVGQYILIENESSRSPFVCPERYLKPSGKPSIEIGTIKREEANV
jgi:hypothetical protein